MIQLQHSWIYIKGPTSYYRDTCSPMFTKPGTGNSLDVYQLVKNENVDTLTQWNTEIYR